MATGRVPTTANSPLTAKGDLFTYSTAPARLAVGNDGETIVADSSTSTGLRYNPSVEAGKNMIINGGFDIWQRGTSFTALGNVYTADRWNNYNVGTAGSYTASRVTSWLDGFNYAFRLQRNSGATSTGATYLSMAFESADLIRFAGKTVTYSFYARKGADYSPTSSNFYVSLAISQSTDGGLYTAGTNELTKIDTNVVLTTNGTRYSWTFDVPSGYKSARIQMAMTGVGTAGTNDWMEITGVQWEIGSVPTTFSRAGGTIQGELAACQRYFQVIAVGQAWGTWYSTTDAALMAGLPVAMRVTPTATFSTNYTNAIVEVGVTDRTPTSYSAYKTSNQAFSFLANGMTTSATIRQGAVYIGPNHLLSAEL